MLHQDGLQKRTLESVTTSAHDGHLRCSRSSWNCGASKPKPLPRGASAGKDAGAVDEISALHRCNRDNPLVPNPLLQGAVEELDVSLLDVEYGHIGNCASLKGADLLGKPQDPGGLPGDLLDRPLDRETEVQEL